MMLLINTVCVCVPGPGGVLACLQWLMGIFSRFLVPHLGEGCGCSLDYQWPLLIDRNLPVVND